jgi:selenocysteine-specific elongation factor
MIVGSAGHIDHGKTTLVKALTGVDTDRLKEEKARGITIDLGFAYLPRPDGSVIGFVDVPGHERFMRTMLAGAYGIDFVLLVIAADDGVMPQTREHLEILHLLGLSRGLVVLSKADLVDDDTLILRELEIAEVLAGTTLAGADVLPVSSTTGRGLDALIERLDREALLVGRRDATRAFRLAVDRSFVLAGAGTVVTGTVLDGTIALGDAVVISPSGLEARVRSIHVQNRIAPLAQAGDRAALNLVGPKVTKQAAGRGDMVLAASIHAPTALIDAELLVLPGEKHWPAQGMPVRLHHATAEAGARLIHLSNAPEPGQTADVQLVLDQPIAACGLDRFILRDVSQSRTIGGGRFLDLHPPRRRRRSDERVRIRDAWREADPEAALSRLLAEPPHFLKLASFLPDRGLPAEMGPVLIERLSLASLRVNGEDYVAIDTELDGLGKTIIGELEVWHGNNPDSAGMVLERLRERVAARLTAPVFRAIAEQMHDAGQVTIDGGWIHLPTHTVTMTAEDESLWSLILPILAGEERFRPPRVRDIAKTMALDEGRVRALMIRARRVSRVDEIAHDHFFLRTTTAEMVAVARFISGKQDDGWFSAATFRDRLGNGRKVAIQILEFLDGHGVMLRRGDSRRINPHWRDFFGDAGLG